LKTYKISEERTLRGRERERYLNIKGPKIKQTPAAAAAAAHMKTMGLDEGGVREMMMPVSVCVCLWVWVWGWVGGWGWGWGCVCVCVCVEPPANKKKREK